MPRYLVERTFPGGLHIPQNDEGVQICQTVVTTNADDLVTWVHSYVTSDKTRTYTAAERRGGDDRDGP